MLEDYKSNKTELDGGVGIGVGQINTKTQI